MENIKQKKYVCVCVFPMASRLSARVCSKKIYNKMRLHRKKKKKTKAKNRHLVCVREKRLLGRSQSDVVRI